MCIKPAPIFISTIPTLVRVAKGKQQGSKNDRIKTMPAKAKGGFFWKLPLLNFIKSVWFFPAVLTLILLIFTGLKISGSSLEIYNYIFGEQQGSNLIANKPEAIRSDEWLVATQATISQRYNHYNKINNNIGNGEDMTLVDDVPVKDWSTVFRPENWSFFVMPFSYAFAFKWWLMAYLLILSCYFFILALMPKRKWFAILISIGLFFAPFVQWWYQSATLAPIYFSLFAGAVFVYLMRAKKASHRTLWSILLAYLLASFALIIYPPFQIGCTFAVGVFALGYIFELGKKIPLREIAKRLAWVAGALIVAGAITLAFLADNSVAVKAITGTVYPGARSINSGGYGFDRLFSGYLDVQLENLGKASKYLLNQSENSRFMPLGALVILPSIYVLAKNYRKNKKVNDWPLLLSTVLFIVFMLNLFAPFFTPVSNLLLLSKVPHQRAMLAIGILGLLQFILLIRHLELYKKNKLPRWPAAAYSVICFLALLAYALHIHHAFSGFIGIPKLLALSLPLPIVVYFVLRKKFEWAALVLLAFSIYTTVGVNPLYRGVAPLVTNPLSDKIRNMSEHSSGKWIAEGTEFENFPQMNGVKSFSGVYYYPQLGIWKNVPPKNPNIYNRYAHVIFVIDHTGNENYKTHLQLEQDDQFVVVTEPCSNFLQQNNVRYILAQAPVYNKCVKLAAEVPTPNQTFFIYKINY